jgi:hypothetical protein
MNTQICGRDRELELEPRFEAESMIVPSFVRDSQGSHRGPSLSWLTSASDQRDSPAQSETRLVHYRGLFSMENQNLSLTKRIKWDHDKQHQYPNHMYWKNFSRKEKTSFFLFLLLSFLMREADEEQWPCSWHEASGHAPAHPLSRPDGFQLSHTLTTAERY